MRACAPTVVCRKSGTRHLFKGPGTVAINNLGVVVGEASNGGPTGVAFIYSNGAFTPLNIAG
ncbi:MAG: hypothetical protein ACRD2D_00715, partial [Terriglobales bacterium]